MKTESKNSFGIIILLLICFWPVGLFMLYRRLTSDKTDLMRNSNVMRNFGIGFIAFAVLAFTGEISNLINGTGQDILFGMVLWLLFAIGGVLMIWKAGEIKTKAQNYRKYIDLVVNQSIASIAEITRITQFAPQQVNDDLQKMIDMEFFRGAYIDHQDNRIVLPVKAKVVESSTHADNHPVAPGRAVHCDSCGANSVILIGQIDACDYCGSPA